jgi:capsular polysaccharide biosynthesis protein/flagellar biosynthesis chaperone FliJ
VDFGREIDPDDRRQLERIYSEIERRTGIKVLGGAHLAITHRSTSPERNASLVNEIVKKFVGEDRRDAQERAKADLKYYRDKLAAAKTQLSEIDNQVREFNQQYPWLTDTLAEIQKEYENAEAEALSFRQQIRAIEENVGELRKDLAKEKPETVVDRAAEVPPEIQQLRKAVEEAANYFNRVKEVYQRAHRRYQEAEANYQKLTAELKAKDKGDPAPIRTSEPNPKFQALQTRIQQLEKEKEKLDIKRMDADKRVSELYIRRRRAPELIGERGALAEQRATAASTAAEYASGVRMAEKELQRLLSEAHSSRFIVREYARDDRRPVRSTQMKIVTLGLLLGLLVGAGLVGLVEYLDQTFKGIDDTRDYLGIPALGVIPAIYTPRDHRRKLLFRVLSISSAVFIVGAFAATYLTVPEMKILLNKAGATFMEWFESW